MPAENQFKFGITCEFKPLWDEFESLAPGSKKSKMIRYLIYNFLYNNGNRTRNTFEDATSEDWEFVECALKVYNKFIKGNTETMKEHIINKRKFWVEKYDYAISDEVISQEKLKKLKDEGFIVMKNTIPYYLLPNVDQANEGIVLKKMEGHEHEQITRYLSKPNQYYVKCKWRNNSYAYYEDAYHEFKELRKKSEPNVGDLWDLNIELLDKLRQENLEPSSDHPLEDMVGVNLHEINWKDVPKYIDHKLILNKFHLENKRNLKKLRSDESVIFTTYTILKFKTGERPKIIGPRKAKGKIEEAKEWRFYDE